MLMMWPKEVTHVEVYHRPSDSNFYFVISCFIWARNLCAKKVISFQNHYWGQLLVGPKLVRHIMPIAHHHHHHQHNHHHHHHHHHQHHHLGI